MATLCAVVTDILDGIVRSGFRRIVIVNGHGGNSPAHGAVLEWLDRHRGVQVKWHNWWNAPKTWAKVQQIDQVASHASWMENFPWTRLAQRGDAATQKPMMQIDALPAARSRRARRSSWATATSAASISGPTRTCLPIWNVAVEETSGIMAEGWA